MSCAIAAVIVVLVVGYGAAAGQTAESLETTAASVNRPTPRQAQTEDAAGVSQPMASITVSAGYEVHRDRQRYRFENPSYFDTPFLVPHEFTQGYVADNQWLVVSTRFRTGGESFDVDVGLTPPTTTYGDDFDTFFNPGGDVILSGYEADVSMRSFRVAIWNNVEVWRLPFRVGYSYRRDRSRFAPRVERLRRHSNPPSESRTMIDLDETTISQVHEFAFGVSQQAPLGSAWALVAGADVSPVTLARLTTILPTKYPGQELVFPALALGLTGRVQLVWRQWRWPVVVTVNHGRTWSYRSSRQFKRDVLQFGVQLASGL